MGCKTTDDPVAAGRDGGRPQSEARPRKRNLPMLGKDFIKAIAPLIGEEGERVNRVVIEAAADGLVNVTIVKQAHAEMLDDMPTISELVASHISGVQRQSR